MRRVGRSTFRTLYWIPVLCLLGLIVLSATSARPVEEGAPTPPGHWLLTALAWAFCVWLFLGGRIAYRLVPWFVSTLSCPGCGEEIDAVDVWNCACGFHPHREHHILAGRCSWCGKTAGRLNCPRCDCTILLW